ncbi:putative RNA-directed DNA polymerase from transposon BS [Caerostris darwini]|uniref:RNA-directed DNA polymerase from transposon BS n=1 Tax=Caerostris darwini TaxID=1538125 RepID=A0AAV4SJK0_9ARAC|nr:putative RNA-directed DNA polymerase from transposon BS [Caerostris darwini]
MQYAVQAGDHFQDIWILTDSRASIQHPYNWCIVGDQTNLDILKLLDMLSPCHTIHFQWLSSHVGVELNKKANSLAKSTAEENVSHCGMLSFGEISSLAKIKMNKLLKTPPNHSWYFAGKPGEIFPN